MPSYSQLIVNSWYGTAHCATRGIINMATINSTEMLKGMRDTARVLNLESVPDKLASSVVPVMETNPMIVSKVDVIKTIEINVTSASTGPVYTCPTNQDFYLCGAVLYLVKDATCDATDSFKGINGVVNGETVILVRVPCLTLTAQSENASVDFNKPIKLDRGSSISHSNMTFSAGKCFRHMRIYGYLLS